jgi:large subunit ribosomal protein L9
MKVILISDLHHVGHRGDVITAKPGFARNYLIPEGLAVQATHGNLKWFEAQKKKIDEKSAHERQAATDVAMRLDGTEISIRKRAGESQTLYGSVTATEIAGALHEKGFEVDRRRIDLEGGIKTLGEHEVRVRLHSDVVAAVKVTVVAETA